MQNKKLIYCTQDLLLQSNMPENNDIDNSARDSGLSCLTIIQIVFLILKLCKIKPVNHWSWWIVMIPTEISLGSCIIVISFYSCFVCYNIYLQKKQEANINNHLYNLTNNDSSETENPSRVSIA
jgi:hypothetical protein